MLVLWVQERQPIGRRPVFVLDRGDGLLHHRVFFVALQIAGDLVSVAVAFDHVAMVEDRLDGFVGAERAERRRLAELDFEFRNPRRHFVEG